MSNPTKSGNITRDYFRTGFKRWIRWIAVAVVFAIACGFLANWQWNRRIQVVKVITRLDRNWSHSVSPLTDVVKTVGGFSIHHEYRPLLVTGHYLPSKQILLRDQISNGNPGFDVLVPFSIDAGPAAGRIVVIDRGWVSVGDKQDYPDAIPAPPTGRVQLVGRAIHHQQPDTRTAPKGQAMRIFMPVLNKQWGFSESKLYSGFFLDLAVERPKAAKYPVLASKPDISEGNHLSYAFQWVLFALLGFAAIGANIRQDLREKRVAEDPTFVPKVRKRKKVGQADMDAEDALLDG